MHDQESITRMSGADFIALTGSLSVGERDDALSYLWGAHPGLLAAALNWAAHQQELRTARAVKAKRLPDPHAPEPANPEEVAALADSIRAGTPVVVTDDEGDDDEDGPCMKVGCGHGLDDHSLDLERGDRLYCQRCECRRYLSAAAMRVTS